MSNHSRIHNQDYTGPGLWYGLHTLGAASKTVEQKKFAIQYIKHLQQNFFCGECKGHFGNYIETHPLETVLNNDEESLFLWIFNFHNAVNFRLNKKQVSYDEAKKIYYQNSEFCFSDCNSEKKAMQPRIVPRDMPGFIF